MRVSGIVRMRLRGPVYLPGGSEPATGRELELRAEADTQLVGRAQLLLGHWKLVA